MFPNILLGWFIFIWLYCIKVVVFIMGCCLFVLFRRRVVLFCYIVDIVVFVCVLLPSPTVSVVMSHHLTRAPGPPGTRPPTPPEQCHLEPCPLGYSWPVVRQVDETTRPFLMPEALQRGINIHLSPLSLTRRGHAFVDSAAALPNGERKRFNREEGEKTKGYLRCLDQVDTSSK